MSESLQLAQLRLFRQQYLQLLSPLQLTYPNINILRQSSAQRWLYKYIFSYGTGSNGNINEKSLLSSRDRLADKSYAYRRPSAPPARYQLQVLKEVVGRIERSIRIWGTDDDVCFSFVWLFIPRPEIFTKCHTGHTFAGVCFDLD